MRRSRCLGDVLAAAGYDDCECCGGVIVPTADEGKVPPPDEDGCLRCWACYDGRPEEHVSAMEILPGSDQTETELEPREPVKERYCSQCEAPIATGRKCCKCKLKNKRKRDRERQRKCRKRQREGVTHFGDLGPCQIRTYERDLRRTDPQDLSRDLGDQKRDRAGSLAGPNPHGKREARQ